MWFAASQLDESIRNKHITYASPEVEAYVQSVMDRLYPEFNGELKVRLLDSLRLNAFALPNGSVYLNIGLLGRLDNEAQLATILAHEASHFIHQHSLKQRSNADGMVWAGVSFELLTGIPFTGSLLTQGILSGYSQSHETEADEEGFRRLLVSGYDINEALATFKILQDEVKALDIDEPFMFSSHPKSANRIENFEKLVAEHTQSADDIKNRQAFLDITSQIREDILDRYLSMHSYKVLLLMLENEQLRQRYPANARFYLADAYRLRDEEGDLDKARQAYEKTILEAPEYGPSYRGLGLLLLKQGNQVAAASYLKRYLQQLPDARDAT